MAKKKVAPEIAARVRAAILSKGGKLARFSRESGMPYPSLMDYYNGARKPGFDALATIIKHSGVSAEWVLLGEGNMTPAAPPIEERILGHIIQVLAYAQHQLSHSDWSVQESHSETFQYTVEEADLRTHLNDIGALATMAANIYNRVAHLQDDGTREACIRKEVSQILRLKQSLIANHIATTPPDST